MATQHVIIGAGPAGINAIETLRAMDADSQIILVSDEPAYARMVLPYFLGGKIDERAVMTGDDAWFKDRGVSAHIGVRARSVNPGARRVMLSDGSELEYDRLLIASGSRVEGNHFLQENDIVSLCKR